jgi:hypothetical protein
LTRMKANLPRNRQRAAHPTVLSLPRPKNRLGASVMAGRSGVGLPAAAGGPGSSSAPGRGDGGRQPPGGHDLARPMDIQMKKREKDNEWHLMSQIKVSRGAGRPASGESGAGADPPASPADDRCFPATPARCFCLKTASGHRRRASGRRAAAAAWVPSGRTAGPQGGRAEAAGCRLRPDLPRRALEGTAGRGCFLSPLQPAVPARRRAGFLLEAYIGPPSSFKFTVGSTPTPSAARPTVHCAIRVHITLYRQSYFHRFPSPLTPRRSCLVSWRRSVPASRWRRMTPETGRCGGIVPEDEHPNKGNQRKKFRE